MTREEIENIPKLVDFMLDKCVLADSRTKVCERLKEVCNLAIKTVEQEPCEDWYDLPSDEMTLEQARQAVKDLRKKLSEHLEQEPQTMHWQKHTDASGNSWHACPACGRVAYTLTRFCPDCGMRLEAPS